MPSPLKAFTFIDPNYTPGGFAVPPDAALAAGNVPDHVQQCRAIVVALDDNQAENMLAQRGLRPSAATVTVTVDDAEDVQAMREAGLFFIPSAWLLIWNGNEQVVVQVSSAFAFHRVGSVIVAAGKVQFKADPELPAPADVSRGVVDWTAGRHRDALAKAISEAREDLSYLPTKLLRGGHVAGDLNNIIGRLVDAVGRARAVEALDEILPKEGEAKTG